MLAETLAQSAGYECARREAPPDLEDAVQTLIGNWIDLLARGTDAEAERHRG